MVLYIGKTLQKVKRAAPGGEGYVMDHLNKQAVDRYFAHFEKAFKENKTHYPHTFFNDSYEVYGADWAPDLLEQFAKRRGYKLEEHFLEFFGHVQGEDFVDQQHVTCAADGQPFGDTFHDADDNNLQ